MTSVRYEQTGSAAKSPGSGTGSSIAIGQGILKLGAAGGGTNTPLGTTAGITTVSATGAALDLAGFTLGTAEPLTLNGSGINSTGALTNSGVAASYSGPIMLASASTIGSTNGALTITGGITPAAATTLTSVLASGTAYTSLAVNALPAAVANGQLITIGSGATTQTVVTSSAASAGATSITVTSFTANANYAIGAATTPNIALNFAGSGNINITTTALNANDTPVIKFGSGNLTLGVSSPSFVAPVNVFGGTFTLSDQGALGNVSGTITINQNNVNSFGRPDATYLPNSLYPTGFQIGSFVTGQVVTGLSSTEVFTSGSPFPQITTATSVAYTSGVQVLPGGSLVLDNSGTNVNNRLGGRGLAIGGANLTLNPSTTADVTEAVGGFIFEMGNSVVTLTADPAHQTNFSATSWTPRGNSSTTSNMVASTALVRGSSLGSAAANGVATFSLTANTYSGSLASPFLGITTASGAPTTQGIIPYILVDTNPAGYGTSFATADVASGTMLLRPLKTAELTASSAITAAANVLVSAASTTTATWTTAGNVTVSINSLTLTGGGGVNIAAVAPLAGKQGNILTITSGGLLATGTTNLINGGLLNWGNSYLDVFTPGATASSSNLEISSRLSGTGLIKAGGGTLVLSNTSPAYSGYSNNSITNNPPNQGTAVFINQGTLKLNSNNAIGNNGGAGITVANGATLDLNAHTVNGMYLLSNYYSDDYLQQPLLISGGTITNSGATTASLNSVHPTSNGPTAVRFFGGSIQGNIGFSLRGGGNNQGLALQSANTYTGPTLVVDAGGGSGLALRDYGTLANTSGIEVGSLGLFTIDNANGVANVNNRINPNATLTLDGGKFTYLGRAQTISTENFGAVTAALGYSTITVTPGNTGVNAAELTMTSLSRTAGATLNITAGSGTLGQLGFANNPRVFITNALTGNVALIGAANNQIIPGVVVGSNDLASYNATTGIGALGQAGFPAYNTGTPLNTLGAVSTANYYGSGPVLSGGQTINALRLNGAITFVNSGDILTLTSGMVVSASQNFGTTSVRGGLTSATGELILHANGSTTTVNSVVSGANKLVLGNTTTNLTANNLHTGGTTVDGGTLNLTNNGLNTPLVVAVPNATVPANGLVLTGATATLTNSPGQIGSGNIVTLNGNSTLNLFSNNTLAGLVFGNNSTTAPVVNTGGVLTLTGTAAITTTSNTVNGTPSITGVVSLPSGSTLSIGAATFNTLIIDPTVADLTLTGVTGGGGAMTKSGSGVLQFNAIGTLSGALDVTGGGLQSGGTNGGSRLLDVTLESGTRINLNGNSALFGSLAGTGLVTNTGALNTLTVGSSNGSSIFAGSFQRYSDSTVNLINLTKIGTGTMSLTGSGSTSTASGTLTLNSTGGGGVTFSGNGTNNFVSAAVTVYPDSTLTLDNSGTNVNNRLGGPLGSGVVALTLSGGTLALTANSAGMSETVANTTFNSGLSAVNITPGTSGTTLFAGAALGKGAGGQALVTDTAYGGIGLGANNKMTFTGGTPAAATPGSTTNAVLGWMRVNDGVDPVGFAAYGTNGIRALASNEYAATITAGSSANVALTTAPVLAADTTVNSLILNSAGGVSGSGRTLTVTSGGLIANTGNTGISTAFLAFGGTEASIHAVANASIGAIVTGSAGLAKDGAGNLTLGALNWYTGQTTVNQGTLTLAGGNNTLAANQALVVNKGGTLALGANNQYVGSIVTPGTVENSGGSITGSGVLTTNAANGTFGGSIGGSVSLVKAGANTLTLVSGNSTTGTVSVIGGGLTLKDGGTLSGVTGTPAIKVNYATLTLDNTGYANNNDRLNDAALITLNGGTLTFNGGGSTASTETLGAITAGQGWSNITVMPANSSPTPLGSADLTISSLSRTAGSAATVSFMNSATNGAAGTFGQTGLNPRLNITGATAASLTTAGIMVNNIIPWASVYNGGFASYSTSAYNASAGTGGIGSLGTTGYAAYDSTATSFAGITQSAWNVSAGGNATISGGTVTFNSMRVVQTNPDLAFGVAGDTLNVVSGGLMGSGQRFNVGTTLDVGRVTAGGAASSGTVDLYIWENGANNTGSINARIIDNPAGAKVRLVYSSDVGRPVNMANINNSYTGGTVFNNVGGIGLTAASSGFVIPNATDPTQGLILNNSTVTMSTSAGQIGSSNIVTLNGGSGLTLFGDNTFAGVVFNSNGGTATPTISIPASGKLTLTGDISVTPTNVAVTPIIKPASGTATLNLNAAAPRNVTVSALAEGNYYQTTSNNWTAVKGLTISAVVDNGALTVNGGGVLELSGTNTFTGQLTVENGVLNVATVNSGVAGPLGNSSSAVILGKTGGQTGTLEYTGGTVSSARPFTMATGGTGAFQVDTSGQTLTLSGLIDGSGGLVKTGPGNLTLSGSKTYSGDTTIKGGTLSLGTTGIPNSPNIIVGDAGSIAAVLDVSSVTGGFSVGSAQTLKGIGTITGPVNVTGVLAPGVGIGTLSSGALNFLSGSTYQYQVNSSVATSAGADLQIATGALSLAGTVNLSLSNLGVGSFAVGTVFSLFSYPGSGLWTSGLFTYNSSTLAEDATFSFAGRSWSIDYDATTKGANVAGTQTGRYVNITSAAPTDPYTIWASGTFDHGATLSDQTPGADPDGDGLTNLQEFAFGTDPTVYSSAGIVYDGTDVTTPGSPKMIEDGVSYSAVFGRRTDYATAGITYTVQFSADLSSGNWTTSTDIPTDLTSASAGIIHAVKVPFPGLIPSASGYQKARFFRVGISQP